MQGSQEQADEVKPEGKPTREGRKGTALKVKDGDESCIQRQRRNSQVGATRKGGKKMEHNPCQPSDFWFAQTSPPVREPSSGAGAQVAMAFRGGHLQRRKRYKKAKPSIRDLKLNSPSI